MTKRTHNDGNAETDPKDKLVDLIKTFDHGMLVTRAEDGELRSRPMRIVGAKPSGALVFVTSDDGAKLDEIELDPRVNVSLQDGRRFVSLSGGASTSRDRNRIGLYHDRSWDVWFPDGVSDPSIVLIDVAPTTAEYWDGNGLARLRYAVEAAKAAVKGETIEDTGGDHSTVRF